MRSSKNTRDILDDLAKIKEDCDYKKNGYAIVAGALLGGSNIAASNGHPVVGLGMMAGAMGTWRLLELEVKQCVNKEVEQRMKSLTK